MTCRSRFYEYCNCLSYLSFKQNTFCDYFPSVGLMSLWKYSCNLQNNKHINYNNYYGNAELTFTGNKGFKIRQFSTLPIPTRGCINILLETRKWVVLVMGRAEKTYYLNCSTSPKILPTNVNKPHNLLQVCLLTSSLLWLISNLGKLKNNKEHL